MFYRIIKVNFLQWVAVLFFVTLPISAHAATVTLPSHGGSGGSSFTLTCGPSRVLVGMSGRKAGGLEQIRARCVRVTNGGAWFGGITETGSVGGGFASEFSITCPTDMAVKGISGNFGSFFGTFVNQITLRCRNLNNTSGFQDIRAFGSTVGNTSFNLENCPNSKPARSLHGRAGLFIDKLGLVCQAGSSPTFQPLNPPSNVVAVNLVDPQNGPSTTQPTPFVQMQWIDQSAIENYYRIEVSGPVVRVFDNRGVPIIGSSSQRALTITDLPSGVYSSKVCSVFSTTQNGGLQCTSGNNFTISQSSICSPTITSADRIGAGTGRVNWTYNCNNPNNFTVRLRCGNSNEGVVASTFNGAARTETFSFGIGQGSLRVCAIYSGQSSTAFCSAARAFQCN